MLKILIILEFSYTFHTLYTSFLTSLVKHVLHVLYVEYYVYFYLTKNAYGFEQTNAHQNSKNKLS